MYNTWIIMKNDYNNFFESIINNIHFNVLGHGHFYGDSHWKFYDVNSPFNRMYFIIDGGGWIENRKQNMILKSGNMYVIPLHSTNNYICNDFIEKFYMHFSMEIFPGIDVFESFDTCICKPVEIQKIHEIMKLANSKNAIDIIMCKAEIFKLIAQFLSPVSYLLSEQMSLSARYMEVYKYIKSNCNAELSVKAIANNINVSSDCLSRSFKADIGYSLKNYIDKKIIQSAKEMILLTNMSIKQIAHQLKFDDEFYFSRYFKKYVGMSPKNYRKYKMMK